MLRGRSLICCRSFEAPTAHASVLLLTPPCVCGPDVIEVTRPHGSSMIEPMTGETSIGRTCALRPS
jgi:hypothetical protein